MSNHVHENSYMFSWRRPWPWSCDESLKIILRQGWAPRWGRGFDGVSFSRLWVGRLVSMSSYDLLEEAETYISIVAERYCL